MVRRTSLYNQLGFKRMIKKLHKLILITQNIVYSKALLQHQVAASVEHTRILSDLQKYDFLSIVDIGANRGQFALVARSYFPRAEIYSFEPLKEPAEIFRKMFISDPMVILHEIAIGTNEENTTIHVSRADDSSSLLPISPLQSTLFPGTEEKETRNVQVKNLNAVLSVQDIKQPALLKVDVQGFEKEVLEGCSSLLSSFSHIYVECSFVELYIGQSLAYEVIAFLSKAGFVLVGIYNLEYDKKGHAIQGDFLFEKKSCVS